MIVKGALGSNNGTYIYEHVAPGTYLIKTTAIGYAANFSNPFIINNSTEAFRVPEINMQPAATTLQTVNIQSGKPLIEHKADRTVMNVENSVLVAGNSAMDILERAPGVTQIRMITSA